MKLAAIVCCSAVIVAGCSSTSREARQKNPAPCPNVVVLNDASRMIEFAGEEQTLGNVAYSAEFVDVSLACRYYADKPIAASIDLAMAFGSGAAAPSADKEFKYFVAVTRRDMEVISKKEFAVPVSFSEKSRVRVVDEEIDSIVIPRASEGTSGENFEVVVGFVVTPAQAIL